MKKPISIPSKSQVIICVYMLGVLIVVVLSDLIYGGHDLLFDVLYLLIHYHTLIGRHILQLQEQLPHVHVQHLQLLFQLEHSERVLVQGNSSDSECYVYEYHTPEHVSIYWPVCLMYSWREMGMTPTTG